MSKFIYNRSCMETKYVLWATKNFFKTQKLFNDISFHSVLVGNCYDQIIFRNCLLNVETCITSNDNVTTFVQFERNSKKSSFPT